MAASPLQTMWVIALAQFWLQGAKAVAGFGMIFHVEPQKGSYGGGTELHIAGTGFADVTDVLVWWQQVPYPWAFREGRRADVLLASGAGLDLGESGGCL